MKTKLIKFFNGFVLAVVLMIFTGCGIRTPKAREIKVASAFANIELNDANYSSDGSIDGNAKMYVPLRVQTVIITDGSTKICMTSCDLVIIKRDLCDMIAKEIESGYNIPSNNILFCATHSHRAPASSQVTNDVKDQTTNLAIKKAILESVRLADNKLKNSEPVNLYFALGYANIGQNSRVILDDSSILWVPLINKYGYNRPTGPFDPQLPVLVFKDKNSVPGTILFNYSTHNIGPIGGGFSPCFYGLASREIEESYGGTVLFFPGACGSTHVLGDSTSERIFRIVDGIKRAYTKAERRDVQKLVVVKKEFDYRVRTFDEDQQQKAVSAYCRKYVNNPEPTIKRFKIRRDVLAKESGQIRKSWIQVILLGDIAFVAVPGELFGELGMEIKRLSPFRYTYIIGYANDYIGYLPDIEAFKLGGYQTWAGPCMTEQGTGEAIVKSAVSMLKDLSQKK